MTIFLTIIHILVSITMIIVVLLQSGKGAEMGASFGAGGSQSVFGATGGTTFMSKVTSGAAIIFMLTSLTLAYRSSHTGSSSIMSSVQQKQPAAKGQVVPAPQQAKPAQAPAGQPTPAAKPLQQPVPAK